MLLRSRWGVMAEGAMIDEERVDSTTIDEKHRILKEHGGLTFVLNEFDNPDDLKRGEEFARAHGWGNLVICETAYSLFGRPLKGCVSIWGKKQHAADNSPFSKGGGGIL